MTASRLLTRVKPFFTRAARVSAIIALLMTVTSLLVVVSGPSSAQTVSQDNGVVIRITSPRQLDVLLGALTGVDESAYRLEIVEPPTAGNRSAQPTVFGSLPLDQVTPIARRALPVERAGAYVKESVTLKEFWNSANLERLKAQLATVDRNLRFERINQGPLEPVILRITSERQLDVITGALLNVDKSLYRLEIMQPVGGKMQTRTLGSLPLDQLSQVTKSMRAVPRTQSAVKESVTLKNFWSSAQLARIKARLARVDQDFQIMEVERPR